MATYTPSPLIKTAVFGNGAGAIATWRVRDTANVNVHRTLVVVTPTAASTFTIEVGATAADTVAQKVIDAKVLVVNVPDITNWWVVAAINDYFEGFANQATVNGASYGYSYA